ncbi:MAG: endolytic transglycosylase MltG [Acidobacteria bacterium]|nr:endolytic transglycosylase MltG [Acidobacteriota bacterium]
MRRIFLSIALALAIVFVISLAGTALWLRSELVSSYYGSSESEMIVEVPRHVSTSRIADMLVDSGILRRKLPFLIYLRLTDKGHAVKAGEYKFAGPVSPVEVARRLTSGDVFFRSITVPEGLTAQETIELLARNGMGDLAEMEQLLLKTELVADIDPAAKNLEGYLFPETYRFGSKADSELIIRTMVNQFRTRIARATQTYPLPDGWDIRSIVILASMIEKEVKKAEEGPIVASVFTNRLGKRMPLACDATIIYAMKLAGTYEGRLGRADLIMESPYNSYIHPGLPPGPIANPGDTSLCAALNPAQTDYYYYVSRNDGTHQFSKNFAHHQVAVDRYQRSLR